MSNLERFIHDRHKPLPSLVRAAGDWERWLAFFLEGVEATSRQAAEAARATLAPFDTDRKAIQTLGEGTEPIG